jgi:hypothetical protein
LTDLGELWVHWADQRLRQEIALAIDAALTWGKVDDEDKCLWAKLRFDEYLSGLRETFGDRACLIVHPGWHPDD